MTSIMSLLHKDTVRKSWPQYNIRWASRLLHYFYFFCLFMFPSHETATYTHLRSGGCCQVSHRCTQISKQLGQLTKNKTKQANKKTPPHNQVKNYWQRKSCCIIVNVLRCQNMKGQEGFNTMALFSWMFLSRFFRLWESSSSSLSSSSSSSFSSSCFCFTFCLPLDICEGDFPLTGFLTLFSCVSFLGEATLLTGNLRRKFSKKSLYSAITDLGTVTRSPVSL